MIISINGLTFDESNPKCKLHSTRTGYTGASYLAFISCIDDTGEIKKYCGLYDPNIHVESIKTIILYGGKWPVAFRGID